MLIWFIMSMVFSSLGALALGVAPSDKDGFWGWVCAAFALWMLAAIFIAVAVATE